MRNKIKIKFQLIVGALLAFLWAMPFTSSAHENYVLSHAQIDAGMRDYSLNVFNALKNPHNLIIGVAFGLGSFILFVLYFLFQHSKWGIRFDKFIKRFDPFGSVVLRFALGISFIASAQTHAYLGPEISVYSLPFGGLIHILLYILGIMLIIGLFSEVIGAVSLLVFILATIVYKDYILTYFNYFGEFIALIFFGSKVFSVDRLLQGTSSALGRMREKFKQYEIAIIRITYGISVLYPAISIKLLHPIIIVEIVQQYHLTQFHWLFPQDPLLIALGTGLAQVVVGTAIILGFQTRLNTLITFVLMAMSVLFFKEAVWPHYILLALALYLMINNGGEWGLDSWIQKKWAQKRIA
ncbi:MAG: hypothetical protein JWO40_25 [Candidatus Doudnabacteria bacterium]|nr:hypothetical protein [Candidatus Doudnabacteria bacterium]